MSAPHRSVRTTQHSEGWKWEIQEAREREDGGFEVASHHCHPDMWYSSQDEAIAAAKLLIANAERHDTPSETVTKRRPGRPPLNKPRVQQVVVSVSMDQEDYYRLREFAESADVSVSRFARRILLNELIKLEAASDTIRS